MIISVAQLRVAEAMGQRDSRNTACSARKLAAAGLQVLVGATDRAAAEGVALVVRTTEGAARRALRRTGVDAHVAVHEDLATAPDLDGPPAAVPPPVARTA
jgi:hypothetical protein